jgi:hypothetical protein
VQKVGTPWFSDTEPGENLAQSHPQAPGGSQDFWRSRQNTEPSGAAETEQILLAQQTQNTDPSGAAETTQPSGAAETVRAHVFKCRTAG